MGERKGRVTMAHTLTCDCGEILTGQDDADPVSSGPPPLQRAAPRSCRVGRAAPRPDRGRGRRDGCLPGSLIPARGETGPGAWDSLRGSNRQLSDQPTRAASTLTKPSAPSHGDFMSARHDQRCTTDERLRPRRMSGWGSGGLCAAPRRRPRPRPLAGGVAVDPVHAQQRRGRRRAPGSRRRSGCSTASSTTTSDGVVRGGWTRCTSIGSRIGHGAATRWWGRLRGSARRGSRRPA